MAQMQLLTCVAVLAGYSLAFASAGEAWPASLQVSRHFHETAQGALHYVMRGDPRASPPLVLLHGDPRSTFEFKYFALQLPRSQPFVAVDYYGFGASDDCRTCDNATDEFVSFPAYAAEILALLSSNGVKKFVPVGNLKGTEPAIALAHLAGPDAVDHLVLVSPLVLSKSAVDYMLKKFIPSIRNRPLEANGSHLVEAWNNPSSQPCLEEGEAFLSANEEKTVDILRTWDTSFRNQLAWLNYTSVTCPTLQKVAQFAQVLYMYSPRLDAFYAKFGLDPEFSRRQLLAALNGSSYELESVDGGCQGMIVQNASFFATRIERFLSPSSSAGAGAVIV